MRKAWLPWSCMPWLVCTSACATLLTHMFHMTLSYLWCVTWLIHMWTRWLISTWLSLMCDMTRCVWHSCVCHDSCTCPTCTKEPCNHTKEPCMHRKSPVCTHKSPICTCVWHSCVCHDSCTCPTCTKEPCNHTKESCMHTKSPVCTHKSPICTCVWHSCVCHDSCTHVRPIMCNAHICPLLFTHSVPWSCVPWLIHVCDMTHSCVWHDSFICVTWLTHVCDMTHAYICALLCVMHTFVHYYPQILSFGHACHHLFAPQHVQYYSLICFTWLSHICDMTHSCAWHDSSMCVTWLIHMCDSRTHLRPIVCNSHICPLLSTNSVPWSCMPWLVCTSAWAILLTHMFHMTHPYSWHDSYRCVTWFIHVCDMTHAHICALLCVMRTFADYYPQILCLDPACHDSFAPQHVQCDSFMCVTGITHKCDMTHSHAWHDSFVHSLFFLACLWVRDGFPALCVTWLFHMWIWLTLHMTSSWRHYEFVTLSPLCVWHDSFITW